MGLLLTLLLLLFAVTAMSSCGDGGSSASSPNGDDSLPDQGADQDSPLSDGDVDAGESDVAQSCSDDEDCPDGLACDPMFFSCRLEECDSDETCSDAYSGARYCEQNRLCLPIACNSNSDCKGTSYCTGGYCTPLPECSEISDILIDPIFPILYSGIGQPLSTHILDVNGTVVPNIGQYRIRWQSLSTEVATVDDEECKVYGSVRTGTTTLVAKVEFLEGDCPSINLSATITVQNLSKQDSGLRVIVADKNDWSLVGDALVIVNGHSMRTPVDTTKGVSYFEDVEPPYDIHVFHSDYHYVSLIGLESDSEKDSDESKDFLIPLEAYTDQHAASGVKAVIDFTQIPDILHRDLRFGISGMSYTRSLLDMHLGAIFSNFVMTQVPFSGPFHSEIPFPSNVSLNPFKSNTLDPYYVDSEPNSLMSWSLGGFISESDLVTSIIERMDQGWSDVMAFLLTSLSQSARYYHGVQDTPEIIETAMVIDDGNQTTYPNNRSDLNGNGDTGDLVPNYEKYQDLEAPLSLEQPLSQKLTLQTGTLPMLQQHILNGLFSMVGVRAGGAQFVPMGIGMRVVETDAALDKPSVGSGGELNTYFAPYYGPLTPDEYIVVTYALPFSRFIERDLSMMSYSAIIQRFTESPSDAESGDFLQFVHLAYADTDTRQLQIYPNDQEADLHRLCFKTDGRRWEVFLNKDHTQAKLPIPPEDDPLSNEFEITAIDLIEDQTLDSIATFNRVPLSQLDRKVARYSRFFLTQR